MKTFIIIPFCFLSCLTSCFHQPDCEPTGTLVADGARTEAVIRFTTEDEKYWREEQWGEKVDHKKLVDAVFEAVYKGQVNAYDFFTNKPISADEVSRMESHLDTLWIENPETGAMDMKVVEVKMDRKEITRIFFKENWYLDEASFTFAKKVIGITLTTRKYSESGELLGIEPLFTVYCDPRYAGVIKESTGVNKPVH